MVRFRAQLVGLFTVAISVAACGEPSAQPPVPSTAVQRPIVSAPPTDGFPDKSLDSSNTAPTVARAEDSTLERMAPDTSPSTVAPSSASVGTTKRASRPPWSQTKRVSQTTAVGSCTVTSTLRLGSESADVACLERALVDGGYLKARADNRFDSTTEEAVQLYQYVSGFTVDGVADLLTVRRLGLAATNRVPSLVDAACPPTGHAALVDRALQQGWLCADGVAVRQFPLTSANTQPDPGVYPVFAKDLESSSTLTGRFSRMTHFVAFTRGKYQNARVAFHSVPTYSDGNFVQPLGSVGTTAMKGESSGCLRVLPVDAVAIWDWLSVGDPVVVLT